MDGISFLSFTPMILLLILFIIRVPIGTSLILTSMYYFVFINTAMPPDLALQNMVSSLEVFTLLAVPFFVMVGVVMNASGISKRLYSFADLLVGHMNGGLGQVNVVISTLMGGISGSSNADTAMDCKMLVPEMERRGYDKAFSGALSASSSIIPAMIPPGIVMIIYAMVAKVSIGRMFLAGYVPGFMLCIGLMIAVHIISKKRGYGRSRDKIASLREILIGAMSAIFALLMPFGFLLGIRFGLFTPTEGGAIAVVFCLLVGVFVYKEIKWSQFYQIIKETFTSTAEVLYIVVGASLFGYYLSWERIPVMLSNVILQFADNKFVFLLVINVILLFLGMFIEAGPAIIILVPLLMAPLQALGIDPIHFGIIMTLNLVIGGITPPFGSMMFISCSLLKLPMQKYVKANMPFLGVAVLVLLIITYVPGLVMFIPNLVMP